jgi:hypothetical protein
MLLGALMALAATGARGAAPAPLPGSDDCLTCHQSGAPLAHREADQPPHFDADGLRASPHAGIECVACHADLKGQEFPHAAKLQPVNCGACHVSEASQYGASIHGAQSARGDAAAPTRTPPPTPATSASCAAPATAPASRAALRARPRPTPAGSRISIRFTAAAS